MFVNFFTVIVKNEAKKYILTEQDLLGRANGGSLKLYL